MDAASYVCYREQEVQNAVSFDKPRKGSSTSLRFAQDDTVSRVLHIANRRARELAAIRKRFLPPFDFAHGAESRP